MGSTQCFDDSDMTIQIDWLLANAVIIIEFKLQSF